MIKKYKQYIKETIDHSDIDEILDNLSSKKELSNSEKEYCLLANRKIMASEKKKRKTDKRLHWGRGQSFCKTKGKGIKGLDYYTPSQRQVDKKIDLDDEVSE